MLGNGGGMPQSSRTAISVAILVVAAVCVALVSHHDSGDLKEETSPDISTTPELRLVQMPMILASDSDIRRAIAAKEHKATKAKNQAQERRHKADKVGAHAAKHKGQFMMPSSMQKMVEARNHKYELQQRQRQMAAALENPSSDDDDVQLFQVLEFTDDTERRAAKKESGVDELLQVDAAVRNFSDDIAKELSDFTSSSHAVASNLLDDDEEEADSAKTNVAKLQTSLPKPHPKKKVAAKKKKTVKKTKTKARDDDMDDGGPMARFVAFQRAKQAMKNALGTANKEAKQSTMDEDDNLQLFQVRN